MNRKPTKKQLDFARHKAAGLTDLEAARMAGYKIPKRTKGMTIAKSKAVAPLLAEMREKVKEVAVYDALAMLRELDEAIQFAIDTGNATARVRAVEMKGKLCGLLIDRSEQKQVGNFSIQISGIDDEPPKPAIDVTSAEVQPQLPEKKGLFDDE